MPPGGDPDQHLHAGAGPRAGGVRDEGGGDVPGQGLLHQHHDAGTVHPDGLHAAEDQPNVANRVSGGGPRGYAPRGSISNPATRKWRSSVSAVPTFRWRISSKLTAPDRLNG